MNRKRPGLACFSFWLEDFLHDRQIFWPAFPVFSFALIFERRFKFFDDGLGLRRSGGLGFSQSGSFFSLAQQEFKLSGIKLLAFDSEEPPDQQIDFFLEQRVFTFQQLILRLELLVFGVVCNLMGHLYDYANLP